MLRESAKSPNRLDRRKKMTRGAPKAERKPLKVGRRPLEERTRLPNDAPSFATSYGIRLGALIILHERESSAADIARMINEDVSVVTNHLRDLYDAGCIEFVGYEGEGNLKKVVYRAITRPLITDEEHEAMSPEERHEINGVAIQWIMAECLSSFRNGKMDRDKALCLITDSPILDPEGQVELRDFLTASWRRESDDAVEALTSVQEIASKAAARMAQSEESGTTVVVTLMAFERGTPWVSEGSPREPLSEK
jgi:DNA-binding transcriptional ArsR family regulator